VNSILSIQSVTKSYGPIRALHQVSFDVPPGSVFGVLGPNGSGKTTLLGIVSDVLKAGSGSYSWFGEPPSEKQRQQIRAAKQNEVIIDRERLTKCIDGWQYPLHFLDYETFSYAIPQFDGIKPFQQMCFQYSLHTIDEPGGEVTHQTFLARDDESNPARALAESLKGALSGEIGTVFVWYESFEKTRNSEMAQMFPDLAPFFEDVNAHTCDLMKVFSENLYVDPKFKGRSSIKKVLPVLRPNLSYKDLGIGDGLSVGVGSQERIALYHATLHEHPMAGGYIGRMPVNAADRYRGYPLTAMLLRLSGDTAAPSAARSSDPSPCEYLVVDRRSSSAELKAYVAQLPADRIASDEARDVYRLR